MLEFHRKITLKGNIYENTTHFIFIGCISLLITSIFRIIDLMNDNIIPLIISVPLYFITLIGMICGIIWIVKKKGASKNEREK